MEVRRRAQELAEDHRQPERRHDRDEDRGPVPEPLSQVLPRDEERDAHGLVRVPQRPAGEVEEDRLEVGRDEVDAADGRARPADDRIEQRGSRRWASATRISSSPSLAALPVTPSTRATAAAAAAMSPVSASRTVSSTPMSADQLAPRALGADLTRVDDRAHRTGRSASSM